jgi:hypothetical protein
VTTALLQGVRYAKDNRVLPRGFDKTAASDDIAVRSSAGEDDDFIGGADRIRYEVDLAGTPGPLTVTVELRYQSIAFRWAQNLRQQRAAEIDRFLSYYESMADVSAVTLASATATVGGR